MRIGCLLLILFALLALGAPVLAAYLHASPWWLLPLALLLALVTGDARALIGAGVTPGFVALWLIALPSGLVFLMLCAVYWLAGRVLP